ncbi:hypothetical protein BH24ACT4_BH24ACT4_11210 [soil metagenome]
MSDPAPLPPMAVVGQDDRADLDTGPADRAAVAAQVARARIDGARAVRTEHPRAAVRAAAVIDAIVAAGQDEGQPEAEDR